MAIITPSPFNPATGIQTGWVRDQNLNYEVDAYDVIIDLATSSNGSTTFGIVNSISNPVFIVDSVGDAYVASTLGVNNISPQSALDVGGKTRTQSLQITTNYGDGYVLSTDSVGNINAEFYSLLGVDPALTSYDQITYNGLNVVSYIVWTSAAQTQKIRQETYTYNGLQVATATYTQYNSLGVLIRTLTETYTYNGLNVSSITRTLT